MMTTKRILQILVSAFLLSGVVSAAGQQGDAKAPAADAPKPAQAKPPKSGQAKTEQEKAKPQKPPDDDRDDFEATFFVGASIDSFASNETKDYLGYGSSATQAAKDNLQQSSGPQLGYNAGIDFAYRLFQLSKDSKDSKKSRWPVQLWVYGETVHGQRSSEVDCKAAQPPGICSLEKGFDVKDPAGAFIAILRNSTSLEAYAGARLEFFKLNPESENSANLYLKTQAGFLTVQNNGGDVVDDHIKLAFGTIMTSGKFTHSYLEAGWGRSDLFFKQRGRRLKIDGYLQYKLTDAISPYIQMTVDSDAGPGSDSIRTYYGINFSLNELFKTKPKEELKATPKK